MKMGYSTINFSILISFVMIISSLSEARDIYVGGKDGWVVSPSESFNHWAERNRFKVNDTLIFKYGKNTDSVLWVTQENYDKCNIINPIKMMNDGDSKFVLDKSGSFFFISGNEGNCEKGEKLIIAVLAVRPSKPSGSSSPPSSSSLPPQPSNGDEKDQAAPTPSPSSSSASSSSYPMGFVPFIFVLVTSLVLGCFIV